MEGKSEVVNNILCLLEEKGRAVENVTVESVCKIKLSP